MGILRYIAENDMPDMFGKVAIVTGGDSGIGYEVCKQLCKRQCTVFMAVRDLDAGTGAVECILRDVPWAKVTPMHCDLTSQTSIRNFVTEFSALGRPLHLLVNNAGVLNPSDMFQLTEDHIELTLATNYFGPCYLTLLLQDLLISSAPSRIINMASAGEFAADFFKNIDWYDLRGRHSGESGPAAYVKSKMYSIAWSYELNRRLKGSGVDVFAVHPGIVNSPGERKTSRAYATSWLAYFMAVVHGQSIRQGAVSTLYAASEPWLQGRGGRYIGPNPTGLQLFGLAGSNTATRWPLNWHLWLPHHRQRIFDTTIETLAPVLPAAGSLLAVLPAARTEGATARAMAQEVEAVEDALSAAEEAAEAADTMAAMAADMMAAAAQPVPVIISGAPAGPAGAGAGAGPASHPVSPRDGDLLGGEVPAAGRTSVPVKEREAGLAGMPMGTEEVA